jgi:hypothetical protein
VFQIEYVSELPQLEMLIFSSLPFPSLSQEITFGEDVKRCRRRGLGVFFISSAAYNLVLGLTVRIKIMFEG